MSQVLYSIGMVCPFIRSELLGKKRVYAHVEIVVFAHLALQLLLDPCRDLRPPLLVHPPALLDLPHNPPLLALLSEHPSETSIVCRPPEGEVEDEEPLTDFTGQGEEEQYLRAERDQRERVQVGFGLAWVEEGSEDVVRRRYAEYYRGDQRELGRCGDAV